MSTQHPTGFICYICEGIAVVDLEGKYLCAEHAIEAMTTIEIDLRAEESISSATAE
ncbi:MAG: hypothetical protein WCC01_15265 [Acidimicrobiia bacterium]